MQCFSCHRPLTADALIEDANGNRWHVTCYRDAVVLNGGDDPCPPCHDCNQLIWETAPTYMHQRFESGAWRPIPWHPECAPQAPTLGRLENDPPPPPQAIAVEHERATSEASAITAPGPAGSVGFTPPIGQPLGEPEPRGVHIPSTTDICPGCNKLAQRNRIPTEDGTVWHQRCYDKAIKTAEREDKRAAKLAAKGGPRKPRQVCAECGKKIRNTNNAIEPIECELEGGGSEFFDKACYRKRCVDAGLPDPFPPTTRKAKRNASGSDAQADAGDGEAQRRARANAKVPKEPIMRCSICVQQGVGEPNCDIPRSQFRDHVSAHEREPGGWSA